MRLRGTINYGSWIGSVHLKKENGFTLIELLVVIIILSLIVVITVPMLLDALNNSRKSSFKTTTYGVIEAAKLYYTKNLKNTETEGLIFTYIDGVESSEPKGHQLSYGGTKPQNGEVIINSLGKVSLVIHDGVFCAEKTFEESEIIITEKTVDKCVE